MMTIHDPVTVTLSQNDIGQILDGLRVIEEQWSATVRYHETGQSEFDVPTMECSDREEALAIAETYRRLITSLEAQLRRAAG